jgi:hypothetical protein
LLVLSEPGKLGRRSRSPIAPPEQQAQALPALVFDALKCRQADPESFGSYIKVRQ